MLQLIRAVSLISVCLLGVEVLADPPPTVPQDGALLLRNGELLQGRISLVGDRYLVTWGENSEVKVPLLDVERCCRDPYDAYLYKRSLVTRPSAGPHLDLAEWCLRHALLSPAADELLAATALESRHPRIRLLERRLELAAGQAKPPPSAPPTLPESISLIDVDRVLKDVPEAAVEKFTTSLQPLLFNRCGANACHGNASKSNFQLNRPSWGKSVTQRFTQRNLYSTLQFVDRQTPEQSRLLTLPCGPHGTLATAVFNEQDKQFAQLSEWVRLAARQRTSAAPKTIIAQPSQSLQASFAPATSSPEDSGAADKSEASGAAAANAPGAGGARPSSDFYAPRDEFDPELFNRRFRGADSEPPK